MLGSNSEGCLICNAVVFLKHPDLASVAPPLLCLGAKERGSGSEVPLLRHRLAAANDLGAATGGVLKPEEAIPGGRIHGGLRGDAGCFDLLHQRVELREWDAEGKMVRWVERVVIVEKELDAPAAPVGDEGDIGHLSHDLPAEDGLVEINRRFALRRWNHDADMLQTVRCHAFLPFRSLPRCTGRNHTRLTEKLACVLDVIMNLCVLVVYFALTNRRHDVRQFKVVVERHADGFIAYPLGFKGAVVGEGESVAEAIADVTSAIRFSLETFGREALEDDMPVLDAFLTEVSVAMDAQVPG